MAFKILLEVYASSKDYSLVPSSSFIKENIYFKTENAPRIKDLSLITSPFLSGSLDSLITANTDEKWIGLWETNRGCPFTCTYCDWGSATGSKQMGVFPQERLKEEMEWFSHHSIEYIFCCDANFGMFKRDPELAQMVGQIKQKTGYLKLCLFKIQKIVRKDLMRLKKFYVITALIKALLYLCKHFQTRYLKISKDLILNLSLILNYKKGL